MTVEEWLGADNRLGIDIWNKKYRYENETFDEWLDRVTGGNEAVKWLILEKKFLYGGRILANRGLTNGRKITYSNCYVVTPPEDNIESIFDCARNLARTYSYGGGCGVDLSRLAPRGATIHNAAKTTSGAVSFMDLYSMVTGLIGQAGRRGALMISLSCEHPDVGEFIEIKNDLSRVLYANISVRVTDAFMDAVRGRGIVPEDTSFRLHFTREETGEEIEKIIDAREFFAKLAENNWNGAEPGILFWDRIRNWNLLSNTPEFEFGGVNPCAEEPLPPGGSCLLSSINLSEFVENPFTPDAYFNTDEFEYAVEVVTEEMNNVLDEGLPLHPLAEQRESVRKWRQIGIGIMGFADMLIKLGVRYGSVESIAIINDIGSALANTALCTSASLAYQHGRYPGMTDVQNVLDTPYFKAVANADASDMVREYGLRNSQLLTIAPTGSISTMLNISGGMEPIFATSYNRTTKTLHGDKDVTYKVYAGIVQDWAEQTGNDPDDLPDYMVTAHQLNYTERLKVQAAWQRYIDASISSTVNLPNEATVEDVADLYLRAWEMGLKGVTIYRDGCDRKAILTETKDVQGKDRPAELEIPRGVVIDVPERQTCEQFRIHTACGSMYVQVGIDDDGNIVNCHTSVGDGGCRCNTEATSRMMSLAIRSGTPIEKVISQLRKARNCPAWQRAVGRGEKLSKGSSCPSAIANILTTLLKEQADLEKELEALDSPEREIEIPEAPEKVSEKPVGMSYEDKITANICPDCGNPLTRKEGCISCLSCGWSKCI